MTKTLFKSMTVMPNVIKIPLTHRFDSKSGLYRCKHVFLLLLKNIICGDLLEPFQHVPTINVLINNNNNHIFK